MSTPLYNNACASAQAKVNPAMTNRCPENRLVLLSEHSKIVYKRCLEKLALCQLSERCSRVFYVVLNQTVGEDKREDNANSIRLEQLTSLRYDHAAQAMKDLVAMNVIIHREGGKYRNWLSVNFNVEMWGNANIAEQHKSNNPELLLPAKYTETPVDNGLVLDPSKLQNLAPSTENTSYRHTVAASTASSTTSNTSENPEHAKPIEVDNSPALNTQNTAIDTHAVQTLETKLTTLFSKKLSSALETINQTLQGFEKHLSTVVSTQASTKTDEKTDNKTVTNTLDTPQAIAPIPAQNQLCQNDQERQEVVVSSDNYEVNVAAFNYPEELDTEQCQALQGLLIKSGDRAQDLLTLLAQRLKNTHNPVADPTSYFASLVYKYQHNTLDFSGLNAIKLPKSTSEKAYQNQLSELKLNHHTCYSDYRHFEQLIETEMKKSQKSFKYVCENNPLGGIIEDYTHQLQQAKTALDDFLAGDEVISA